MRFDGFRDAPREFHAIHCQGFACGHLGFIRNADDERTQLPHLLFEKSDCVSERVRAKRITAHELREIGRRVRRR